MVLSPRGGGNHISVKSSGINNSVGNIIIPCISVINFNGNHVITASHGDITSAPVSRCLAPVRRAHWPFGPGPVRSAGPRGR